MNPIIPVIKRGGGGGAFQTGEEGRNAFHYLKKHASEIMGSASRSARPFHYGHKEGKNKSRRCQRTPRKTPARTNQGKSPRAGGCSCRTPLPGEKKEPRNG